MNWRGLLGKYVIIWFTEAPEKKIGAFMCSVTILPNIDAKPPNYKVSTMKGKKFFQHP